MIEDTYDFVTNVGYQISDREVLHEDPRFRLSYDLHRFRNAQKAAFLHVDVNEVSVATYKEIHRVWAELTKRYKGVIFTITTHETRSTRRFVESLGFVKVDFVLCADGKSRTLYAHFNKYT